MRMRPQLALTIAMWATMLFSVESVGGGCQFSEQTLKQLEKWCQCQLPSHADIDSMLTVFVVCILKGFEAKLMRMMSRQENRFGTHSMRFST